MEQLRTIEWHVHPQGYFPPYYFFNAHSGWESKTAKKSLYNVEEIDICVRLVRNLAESFPKIKFGRRIGIISFYKEQVYRLKSRFKAEFGKDYNKSIDINTVFERFMIGRWISRSRKRHYNSKLCQSLR
jgi:senataxin